MVHFRGLPEETVCSHETLAPTKLMNGVNQEDNIINFHPYTKTKIRGRSTQANYTDRATAACRRS
jgi:hypothetical protein